MHDLRKYPLSEEKFSALIDPLITKEKQKRGRPPKVSNYQFFCGLLYVLRTGFPWRDTPAEYGPWHTLYTRCKRWSEKGLFWTLLNKLQASSEIAVDIVFLDGSLIPLHRNGGWALKKVKSLRYSCLIYISLSVFCVKYVNSSNFNIGDISW